MHKSLCRRLLVATTILWLATSIGCGSKVKGKYVADGGGMAVEFKSGKAILTSATGESETDDYTVDGDKITIKSVKAGGDIPFTLMQDGSLQGPFGTLKKSAG